MTDENLLICTDCGAPFFTSGEKAFYESKGFVMPTRCKRCRTAKKRAFEMARIANEREQEANRLSAAFAASEYSLAELKTLNFENPETTLYVVGNGFDLLHGVKSSYYDFRDTLGKNNSLRLALETYLDVDDLWADFEDGLAHISGGAMYGVIDMWLENFDAYAPDAQIADICAAADTATGPASTITSELPRRFRMWIESLSLPGKEKPLESLINSRSHALNFNYTEFVETLYGLSEENVCYIHGCRRKKKYCPKEKLIIGHAPGAGDCDPEPDFKLPSYKSKRKTELLSVAVDLATRNLAWYNDETSKNSPDIIKAHQSFFDGLESIESIVLIGHSLSPVDWDYFREILRQSRAPENLRWYISCHSGSDMEHIKRFAEAMKIKHEQITVFKV